MTDLFIQRSATLSRAGGCRLTLNRSWADSPHVCFIGLNPSTADHLVDDRTVQRWIHFARAWGYGGFTAVNLYPFCTPSSAECRRLVEWGANGPGRQSRGDLEHNLAILVKAAKAAALTVACWGASAWDQDWIDQVVEVIQSGEGFTPDLHCFGSTASGAPIHPMARGRNRIPDDTKPILWRAA